MEATRRCQTSSTINAKTGSEKDHGNHPNILLLFLSSTGYVRKRKRYQQTINASISKSTKTPCKTNVRKR